MILSENNVRTPCRFNLPQPGVSIIRAAPQVDSTGIASKLDAEEWRDLVSAYLNAASAAVTDMGGKVAKKLGDGLMALFGYPVAQENDAALRI
jgi:class 3 adenylate cyclase